MKHSYDFYERQYLGYNRFGMIRRLVIALFCLIFYWVSEQNDQMKALFFWLALAILALSALSLLIKHLETRVMGDRLLLIGPVSYRQVEISLRGLKSVEVKPYSRFLLNRPIFNLHRKGSVRFYTYGSMCVEIVTGGGELIRLGSQRPDALKKVLEPFLSLDKSGDIEQVTEH